MSFAGYNNKRNCYLSSSEKKQNRQASKNLKNWPNVSPSFRSSSELCSEISECVCRWESTYKCSPDKTHDDNSMLLAEGNWQAANGSHAAKPTSIEPHQTVIILSMRIVNVSPIFRGFYRFKDAISDWQWF